MKVRIGDQIVDYDPLADFGRDVIKRLERAEKRRKRLDAEADKGAKGKSQ